MPMPNIFGIPSLSDSLSVWPVIPYERLYARNEIAFLIGSTGCHLCFHQRASQQLQVGVELEINSRIQESSGTIAYQIDLPKADLIFRGMSCIMHGIYARTFTLVCQCLRVLIAGSVDTNWTVGAVLEKRLQPLPFTFALSGMMNHSKQQFRLGCGLIVG